MAFLHSLEDQCDRKIQKPSRIVNTGWSKRRTEIWTICYAAQNEYAIVVQQYLRMLPVESMKRQKLCMGNKMQGENCG